MTQNDKPVEATPMPLPQEVVDIIIDLLTADNDAQERLEALCTCNLISSSFHYRAQKILFSHITLVIDESFQVRLAKLKQILLASLLSNIKSVTVKFHLLGTAWVPGLCAPPKLKHSKYLIQEVKKRWLSWEGRFPEIVRLLSTAPIEQLTLDGEGPSYFSWRRLSKLSVQMFQILCNHHSIRSLHFKYLSYLEPWSLITQPRSKSLEELVFSDAYLPWEPGSRRPQLALGRLTHLDLQHTSFAGLCAMFPVQGALPRVKEMLVSLPILETEDEALWSIVKRTAPSLQSLNIKHIETAKLQPGSFQLDELPSLRSLRFGIQHDNNLKEWETNNQLSVMAFVISSSKRPLLIPTITIDVHMKVDVINAPHWGMGQAPAKNGWKLLDKALVSTAMCNLRRIVFNVTLTVEEREPNWNGKGKATAILQEIEKLRHKMPLVMARPSVSFEVYPTIVYSD